MLSEDKAQAIRPRWPRRPTGCDGRDGHEGALRQRCVPKRDRYPLITPVCETCAPYARRDVTVGGGDGNLCEVPHTPQTLAWRSARTRRSPELHPEGHVLAKSYSTGLVIGARRRMLVSLGGRAACNSLCSIAALLSVSLEPSGPLRGSAAQHSGHRERLGCVPCGAGPLSSDRGLEQ
jgi:hypothetical protein